VPATAERSCGERDRGVRPLRGAALLSTGEHAPSAQVFEELLRRARWRRLRPRAPDVDAGVVVGAADPGAVERRDIGRGRTVQLARAGAVAHLPDVE